MSSAAPADVAKTSSIDTQKTAEQIKKTEQPPAPQSVDVKPESKPEPKPDSKVTPPTNSSKSSNGEAKTSETPKDEAKKSEPSKESDSKVKEPTKEAPAKNTTDSPKEATKKTTETTKAGAKKLEPKKGEQSRATPEPPKEGGPASGAPTPTPSEGDQTDAAKPPTLREQFRAFSKFGDKTSEGKSLSLSQSDKWMKQAKVIDGKTLSTTDTAIQFKKFKQVKLTFPEYDKYLTELAKNKNADLAAMKEKMRNCGTPGTRGTTSAARGGAVGRLTDARGFTGSHRQRFDGEGRGRGAAGRRDDPDKSGYVSGYKNKDTYSKTH